MANLLIWWRQRTPSEQRLLLGLTGLLAACAFWYGLWQPWRAREAQWRQTLVKEQASLRWMSHGLTVVRLQPQGKRLQITLQPCAFQALIDWLDAPAMRGVNAISLSVTGQPSRPGWVTVNHLLLERDDEG